MSSHVVRGSVGNRAAVFALERFGFPVWSVPTVILPWHPGHGPATRLVHDDDDFGEFLSDISEAPWLAEIGAVLTGYLANAEQAYAIGRLVKTLKAKNPNILYVCDPVIGDAKGLYVSEETAIAVRDTLVPISDCITPNLFELSWLAQSEAPKSIQSVIDCAKSLKPETKLITSVRSETFCQIGNLLCHKGEAWHVEHDEVEVPPNGTGDLTAALYLAHRLEGVSPSQNLEKTTSAVLELLKHSVDQSAEELLLVGQAEMLTAPGISLSARQVS